MLDQLGLPEAYLGWAMVALASAFWEDQVAAVPPARRLLLLPHRLSHVDGCSTDGEGDPRDRPTCGACSIARVHAEATSMGYTVLESDGSSMVLKTIVKGQVDAVVGIASLNELEKAMDKVLHAGIPCMAVPLLSSDSRQCVTDEDWVRQMIRLRRVKPGRATRTYVHLMRCASGLFVPEKLEQLAPRLRGGVRLSELDGRGGAELLDPVAATEAIAYDFLSKGGKHSRPFITLAAYDACRGGEGTQPDGDRHVADFSDSVKRTAISIETFHKASLVHDDIEDDDAFRYGDPTLHHRYGTATAINVGDYLIGLGYRLVSRESGVLGAQVVCDILDRLADAHLRLSEGQGAELAWRDARDKSLRPREALNIYGLKTAPAFEVALYCGVRLAGAADAYAEAIQRFARDLGVAFQILNDLKDWDGDCDNKRLSGTDVFGGRPTLLLALALERLPKKNRKELVSLAGVRADCDPTGLERVARLYRQADVFGKALELVEHHQRRARTLADQMEPEALRRLLRYVIDTLLDRGTGVPERLIAATRSDPPTAAAGP
jgi:geranylgeranyl pyrophosphate synthase